MKKFFSALAFIAFAAAPLFAQESMEEANPNSPAFEWTETTHDFGTIPQGVPVTNKFTFTNNGKEPLIISNVQKTCGCTVTDWTKEPIMPGQKGFVAAEYNAAKEGPFTKAITVQSNASTPNVKLHFKGTVEKAAQTGSVPEESTIFNNN